MPRLGLATEQDWANLNTSDDSAICALGDRVLFDVVVPRIPSRPITSGGPRRELRPLRRPLRRALAIQVVARIPPGARHAVAAHASCRRGRAYHQRRRAGMHSRPLVGWPCYEPTARAQASAREGGETPTSARPAAARQRAARTASGASGATGHTCCNLLSFTSFRRIKALPHTAAYATQKRLQKTSSGNEAPSVLQVSDETGVP